MLRIAGVNINENKRVRIGLSYIFGIGRSNCDQVLKQAKIEGDPKFSELTADQIIKLRTVVEKEFTVETDLKQVINQNIRRMKEIGTYRGTRHSRNLPVRGQRTKTNARTKRGKRVTMGSGRRKAADKT